MFRPDLFQLACALISCCLLSSVISQSSVGDGFSCEGRKCGHYPKPGNCSEFYVCEENTTSGNGSGNGTEMRAEIRSCAHGLYFNSLSLTCDLPEYAACEAFSCEGRECGLYPDPANCSSYYVCKNGRNDTGNGTVAMETEHKSCDHGLLFSATSNMCDLPQYASCSSSYVTEVESTTEALMEETTEKPRFKSLLPHQDCFWVCFEECAPMTEEPMFCTSVSVCEFNSTSGQWCPRHYICDENLPGSMWCPSVKDCVMPENCPQKCDENGMYS